MTNEKFFPTRWILYGVSREAFADHLRWLRKMDKSLANKAIAHALWIGVYPMKRRG
jgi:hypothetical protein